MNSLRIAVYMCHVVIVLQYGVIADEIIEVRMPGIIPSEDDVYMCTSVPMPIRDAYIVNFEVLAIEKAHQMWLYGCDDIKSSPGEVVPCMGMERSDACRGDQSMLYAWARDVHPVQIPNNVGFHVGGDSRIKFVILQIHYDTLEDGEKVRPGLKLSMQDNKPPHLASILTVAAYGLIPPHQKRYNLDMACEYTNPVPIYPFAFRVHAHVLGRVITGYRIRSGKWTLLGKGDPRWPQAFYPTKANAETLNIGDLLAARCTYSSMEKYGMTYIGSAATDEMCIFYLMYYTNDEHHDVDTKCQLQDASNLIFPADSVVPPLA